jgi:hypothetical protein
MTFEAHARMEIQQMNSVQLDRFSKGLGANNPVLYESPLSDQQLQSMAQDELFQRNQQVPLDQL